MITLEKPKNNVEYALGVDLGGTFIKSAVINSEGEIINSYKIESHAEKNPKKVVLQIIKSITNLEAQITNKISGIGIGSPGIVTDGVVKYPPNFKGWKEIDLKKIISSKFEIKTEVDNDAKCGGLAELLFGYGKKYKNFIFLTLGTGIGGAIIIDGKLYRGEQNSAGEFGMTSIKYDGHYCLGGNPGAVEAYLGRNYFLKEEKKHIKKLGKNLDFEDLSKLASKGNKTAKNIFKHYGFYLGAG